MTQETLPTLNFGEPQLVDRSLSENVRGLVGSEILKIASDIRKLIADGESVCNLTVGDFNSRYFPIPELLLQRIQEALRAGQTNYPPSDGVLELRESVAAHTAREWGARYPVESVLIASGARPILYSAYRTVLDPGDKVIYPVPSWNNNHYVWISGAEGIVVPTRAEDGFMPTLDQLAPHLSEARLLSLNSPLNPTGTVMGEAPMRRIVEAIVEENDRRARDGRRFLFLLHDQVYASLVFGETRHHMPASLVPEAAPYVISLDGISKCFAATGLRVGWVLAPPEVVRRMKNLIGHIGAWAPRPEQVALARFLDDAPAVREFQTQMNRRVQRRLDALYNGTRSTASTRKGRSISRCGWSSSGGRWAACGWTATRRSGSSCSIGRGSPWCRSRPSGWRTRPGGSGSPSVRCRWRRSTRSFLACALFSMT
jgi:aspartate aminotransferase